MMNFASIFSLTCIGHLFLLLGLLTSLAATISVLRSKDFFLRVHSAGVVDSLCVLLIVIGSSLVYKFNLFILFKFLLLIFIFFVSTSTSSSAVAACRCFEIFGFMPDVKFLLKNYKYDAKRDLLKD